MSATAPAILTDRLSAELAQLQAFVAILEDEQRALLEDDSDALLPLADRKLQLAESLNNSSRDRHSLMGGSVADMTAWLTEHLPSGISAWQHIRQTAQQAQQLNQTNGELIQIKLRYNQQALGVLYGAAQQTAGLYGPNGQPHLPSNGRVLGSV